MDLVRSSRSSQSAAPLVRPSARPAVLARSLALSFALSLAVALLVPSSPVRAQEAPEALGTVTGEVVLAAGEAAADLTVTLVELRRTTPVAADGSFRFDAVPPGVHLVLAESPTAGTGVGRVVVVAGETATTTIPLEVSLVRDELVVTATAEPRRQLEVVQPTNVLAGENLAVRQEATLGETLDEQPGVTSTYFGPGASRPVIRGSGGDRIRVLQDGIGAADASNTSPDHAVSVDPLAAERIEVIRGPATLLYGSSAVGGVVNVLDGRIPDFVPERPISGSAEISGGTVSDERSGALSLDGGAGRLAWHADYLARETDDYEIPGFAEVGHGDEEHEGEEEEEAFGVLPNSALDTESGSVGLSWIGDDAFVGVSLSGYDTLYGVPGHGHGDEEHEDEEHGHEEEEGEEEVRIDLEQRRLDLRGELARPFGIFRGAKLRLGVADYEHVELAGAEVGTRFANDGFEGRLELVQKTAGRLSGSFGLQLSRSDFTAVGEEAFVPPSTTDAMALFAFEEVAWTDTFRFQFGGRLERQEISPEGLAADRSFDALSGSVGAIWDVRSGYAVAVSVAHTERIPTANELYANGPHAATRAFEIGSPDLELETSLGVDLALRKTEGPVTGSLTFFTNRYDDYVYESFTGAIEDGLDVIRFEQRDAEFIGGELAVLADLYRGGDSHVALELSGDVVRAELAESGEPLPRIPPLRLGAGVNFHRDRLRGFAELRWVDEQDRLAVNETPTDGYTLLNAAFSYRFLVAGTVLDVTLKGRNLTDEEARAHTSFLKDEVPLPGRDLSLGVRLFF